MFSSTWCRIVLAIRRYGLSCPFVLGFFFVLFCHDVMPTLGCMGCMECVEDHLLFIRVIISLFSGQRVSVLVHICSTSPGKKCVVLCVRGLLCFVDPSLDPSSPDAPFRNIVLHPGVPKLFAMLLDKFHVGLWSSMTKLKLFPLLRHILPPAVMKTLSFIFSRKDCRDFKNYQLCCKMCDTLFRKPAS